MTIGRTAHECKDRREEEKAHKYQPHAQVPFLPFPIPLGKPFVRVHGGRFVGEGGVRSAWVTGRYTLRDWVMSDPFLFKSHLLGKVAQSARFVKGTSR